MPNGEIIECPKIRDTFFEVIEKLGVEKVAALGHNPEQRFLLVSAF